MRSISYKNYGLRWTLRRWDEGKTHKKLYKIQLIEVTSPMTSFLGAIPHMKALDLRFVMVSLLNISWWSSGATRRKIKNGFSTSRANIADIYLKRMEMLHAFCICIYIDLFEVTLGKTLVKIVKLRSNRTDQTRYIQYIYISIPNLIKNPKLFEVQSGHEWS